MKTFKPVFLASTFLFTVHYGFCQKTLPLTADSLATGNFKDVFKTFFQVAVNKLTSENKEVQFSSNPFAVMAKMDTTLLVETNYYKMRKWRNLNFSVAGHIDDAYRFNGFSTGIKYAIINKRDETVSRAFLVAAYNANNELNLLNDRLNAFLSTIPPGPARSRLRSQVDGLINTGTITFNKIDASLQQKIKDFAKEINAVRLLKLLEINPALNFHSASQQTYDSLKMQFQNKLLWTAEISDTSNNNQLFSNVVLTTQLLKGVLNPGRMVNMELDVKASAQLLDDTSSAGRNLTRRTFSFEPGVNVVFKSKQTQKSWAEFKISGSFNHNFTRLYVNERRDNLQFKGALRIRVIDDVWVPLEFHYDPRSGNVFGFLNVRANFTGLSKVFGISGT